MTPRFFFSDFAELSAFFASRVTTSQYWLPCIPASPTPVTILIVWTLDLALQNSNCLSERPPSFSSIGSSLSCISRSNSLSMVLARDISLNEDGWPNFFPDFGVNIYFCSFHYPGILSFLLSTMACGKSLGKHTWCFPGCNVLAGNII